MKTADRLATVIQRARRGDPAAFDVLVDEYSARLYAFLFRLTGDRDAADDLVQEVFLRVVRTIGGYEHDGRFRAWLFRIATNLARDRMRRLGRRLRGTSFDATDDGGEEGALRSWAQLGDLSAPAADHDMCLAEDVGRMQRALAELPVAEREVVLLRHYSAMSFAEIAEAMGTPLGTALARSHRALAKLRKLMDERE